MQNAGHLDIKSLAVRMLRDYDAHMPGTIFGDGLRLTLEDAWKLQHAVASLRQGRGERVAGYKVGCVCSANQRRFGLPHPVWGRLWSTEQYHDGEQLSKAHYANVAIEAEFGVTLGRAVDPDHVSLDAIVDAVENVFPVIELHNPVFHGGDPKGHELIANNAIHAGVVRGEAFEPGTTALTDLSIQFDGNPVDGWTQIGWPHDVLQSVGWLAGQLAQTALRLEKGHVVLTGALGPPLPVGEAGHVKVVSSRFGTVEASFA